MDRLVQLRGEPGGSRDSSLDSTASPNEAYITANESSKYFSLGEEDSSFDISPIKDVSLASSAEPDKAITGNDELISNLSPIPKKNDLLDSYKLGKQIEAANILSGGVAIFDDNDNSYDGDELVIDDNVVEIDDKSNPEMKLMENAGIPFQKSEDMTDSMDSEAAVASKDTEVMLQIDGKNVNAIDIGNGLYLYRKEGEEELAAVQIAVDDPQQPSFKFLKVRENEEGNLEVYEEIEIEVPKEGPSQAKTVEKSASHVPIKDINKVINDPTGNKSVERKKPLQQETVTPTTSNDMEPTNKLVPPETKSEINLFGKTMKLNETRKSPVIHSTPNKEGIPLTKTMVDLQLHPNRHLDNVKTIEVHTDGSNKRPTDSLTKNKDDDLKPEHDTCEIEKPDIVTETKEDHSKKLVDIQVENAGQKDIQIIEELGAEMTDTVDIPKFCTKVETEDISKKVEDTPKSEEKTVDIGVTQKVTSATVNIKENIDNKIKENGKVDMIENANQLCDKLPDGTICVKDDNSNITPSKDIQTTKPCLEVSKPESCQILSAQEASEIKTKTEIKEAFSLEQTSSNLPEETDSQKETDIEGGNQIEPKNAADSKINRDSSETSCKDLDINPEGQPHETQNPIDIAGTALSEPANKMENPKGDNLKELKQGTQSTLEVPKSFVSAINDHPEKGENVEKGHKAQDKQNIMESIAKPQQNITKAQEKTNKKEDIDNPPNKITKDDDKPICKVSEKASEQAQNITKGQALHINKEVSERATQSMFKEQDNNICKQVSVQNVLEKQENLKSKDVSEKPSQDILKKLDKINKEVFKKATQDVLITKDRHLNINISDKSTQNISKDKQIPKEVSEKRSHNILKDDDGKQLNKEMSEKLGQNITKDQVKQNKQEIIPKSVQNISIEQVKQSNKGVTETLVKQKEDAKQTILYKKEIIKDHKDNANDNVKINESAVTIISQTKPNIKRETTSLDQQPIKISNIAVPFGKWTEANRQEFLNKIKETKIPTTSSNTKSLKQANDLNRRDVLKKIDSQRQSACNALSLKTQEASKLNIKNEAPTFINKPAASRETKVPVKTESQVLKKPQPPLPKPSVKTEIAQTSKKVLPKATVGTLSVNKQEVPQRKEINNQDLIDKTIEGIINRAVTTTHKESLPKEVIKHKSESISVDNIKPKEKQSSALDAIESKMNELHGIPFIERPPHELPKVYHRDIKTYAKADCKKLAANKVNNKPSVPFVQKTTQDTIIDLDSEDEVIEHEPITGDINLKPKNIVSKIVALPTIDKVAEQRNIDASKKETIITEKDFEQFARRNSITYENRLTVNFEGNKQHNVTHSVVPKDTNKKDAKNEVVPLESKAVVLPKQKPIMVSNPMNTIQINSKIVPVNEESYQSKLQLAYQSALTTTKRPMESPITIIEDKPVKVVFLDSNAAFPQNQLNVRGRDLSPMKKQVLDNESITNSVGDSLDSDVLDSIDEIKTQDEPKVKSKHQRKQVLTPVETPELELIVPRDLAIDESPKKKRKIEDTKLEKNSKALVPKKSYLLGRSNVAEDSMRQQDQSKNTLKETAIQNNAVVSHKDAASAIDNLVKAAELIETQSETLKASPAVVSTDNSQQVTTVKRGRGRPRKYPLPEGTPAKSNASSPQKRPRLIDAKQKKDSFTTDEDDSDEDDIMIRENWTMGKINENIVCPICNKLFRSENVVFKHVKHCTGPSPNRSDSDKRSTRRSRLRDSDSKSISSKYDDDDVDSEDSAPKKSTPKKRKSKEKSSDGKEDIIVIEDTPMKERAEKRENAKSQESKKVTKTKAEYKTSMLSCEHCGKTFRQLSYLVNHKLLHKKETANKQAETDAQVGDKSVFSCEVCKKEFRMLHHLVQHRLIHNQNNAPSRPSRKSSYEQSVDNKSKKDQDSKQNEDLSAAFRCEQCDKSFRKLHHLVEHRATHSCINKQKSTSQVQPSAEKGSPTPPYKCDICKKPFRNLHQLIEHREQHVETSSDKSDDKSVKSVKSSLSTKDIIHECPLCYMVFPNEHSLNKHSINCQRKKKQTAAKQAKQLEENKNDITEKSETDKEKATEVELEPTPAVKNIEQVTTSEKMDDKSVPVIEKEVQEIPDKEASLSKDGMKLSEQITLPSKRDSEEPISSIAEATENAPKIPHKIKKVAPKSEDDLPLKVITAAKKKLFVKGKGSSPVIKRDKPNIAPDNVPESAAVESSDDDEVRYMLNPDFIEENLKGKVFMKVKARKRNSLQIERPNSKDLVKRRTSLQHPPKIPRLKAKLTEKSDIINTQVNTSRNTKVEPVSSTDSDDSDVKYSFPEKPTQTTEPEKTPKEKRKPLGEKRKTLSGIARRKSLGKSVTAKHKEKISPVKEIKRRRGEVEHRCDCGQLFNSAALLARHTSLAHTPPRVRRRRLDDQPPAAPLAPAAPAAPAARKSASAGKPQATDSRKSSARSDGGKPQATDSRKSSARSDAGKPGRPPGKPARRSVRDASPAGATSALKARKSAAHRGVPVPEKMKKIIDKLRK